MRSRVPWWATALAVLTLVLTASADAQTAGVPSALAQPASLNRSELPANVLAGMDALRSDGPDDAVKFWVKGSPLEFSKDALTQANSLRDIQALYGRFQYFDLVSFRELSSRVRIAYLVMNYERGPLFARFVLYHAQPGWVPVSFQFDTDETRILPLSLQ